MTRQRLVGPKSRRHARGVRNALPRKSRSYLRHLQRKMKLQRNRLLIMNSLNKEGKSFIIVFSCIAYAWMWKRLCAPILEVLAFLHLAAHKMLGWLQFEGKACSQKWKPKIDLCLFASCCTWHNTEAYNSHELDLLLTFDASGICANDFMQHWIRRGTLCDSETKSFSIWFLYMHVHISILPFFPSFIF